MNVSTTHGGAVEGEEDRDFKSGDFRVGINDFGDRRLSRGASRTVAVAFKCNIVSSGDIGIIIGITLRIKFAKFETNFSNTNHHLGSRI